MVSRHLDDECLLPQELEYLSCAGLNVACGRPMIAALVISRAGDMPPRGIFDLAVALGRFPEDPRQFRAAWVAECAAVFGTQADATS